MGRRPRAFVPFFAARLGATPARRGAGAHPAGSRQRRHAPGSRRALTAIAAISIACLVGAAVESRADTNLFESICPAPIQTCTIKPVADTGTGPTSVPPPDDCPDGYRCVCVPSCPTCTDCATQVCVRDAAKPCQTACDCPPGLACFESQCLAGFAPVFCCEGTQCPLREQCQHRDGSMDRCHSGCIDQGSAWLCPPTAEPKLEAVPTDPGAVTNDITADSRCGVDKVCACAVSCPGCDDCVAEVCVPPRTPSPVACESDAQCAEGRHCACVPSCPDCTDCAARLCVRDQCDDPQCEDRLQRVTRRIRRLVRRSSFCDDASQCVQIDTSTACAATCGGWVNGLVEEQVAAVIDRLDTRICSTYAEDGCPVPLASCLAEHPACVDGRCVGLSMQLGR